MDKDTYEVLQWLREYYPDADPQDLPRSLSGLSFAMRSEENCRGTCPGFSKCPTHGYVMKPIMVTSGYGITYNIAGEACQRGTDERRQAQVQKTISSCGVPDKYENCTFDNFNILDCDSNVQIALSVAQKCAQNNLSLVLGGPPGTGKTHLAAAQIKEYLHNGRTALFLPVITLLDEIKKAFDTNNPAAIEDTVKKADFVVLDDLGTQYDTGWVNERVFALVDYRYSHKLPMTITTNATNIEMFEKMAGKTSGFRIVSRVKDSEFGYVHWMSGCRDYRSIRKQMKLAV